MNRHQSWQEIAKLAQEHRDASIAQIVPSVPTVPSDLPLDVSAIPRELLTPEEVDITEKPPEDLVATLASGQLTCTAVTKAFLRRAGLAQQLTNCVTELLPEQALARAKALDDYYAEHKRPMGPLAGLPISVKEHICMKGLGANAGFVSWYNVKSDHSAHILEILWNAGCVFYVRTTEPQTLMHLETSSNLYGVTVNPFNRNLTSGGSSGGEGALLGLWGSCLGIGTDIGGSIRSPAANCGCYGLRPTGYRLPTDGWTATMAGQEQIVCVIGPMSTSLEGVKLFMKTIIDTKPWLVEASLLPFEWKGGEKQLCKTSGKKKLKVGVLWNDGIVKPHPPVIRALKEITEKLKTSDDVEVVDWKPYKHDEAWEIIASLYFCDGAKEETTAIEESGEPWRPLSEFIIKENPCVRRLEIEDLWSWTAKRETYRRAYAKVWNDTASGTNQSGELEGMVDVILCPVGPGAAPPLDNSKYWGYTSQWNLLDYPALVFPVSKVDPQVDGIDRSYEPINEKDQFNYDLCLSFRFFGTTSHQLILPDDPEKYKGAPISLQLVGRRYEDEKVRLITCVIHTGSDFLAGYRSIGIYHG
ncbi:hypothetical protein MMC20_006621 [Loxospora ochrophaea]|nr:hypothetical protein [Loxospora ochrophaea]